MKRKKSPPSEFLVNAFDQISGSSKGEVQNKLRAVLVEVRYAGDIKQLAERYGLHYLKSKRMRTRELVEWIVNNHPAVKKSEEQVKHRIGVDFGASPSWSSTVVLEELPDGSFKVLSAEVGDGNQGDARADRRGRQG